PIWNMGAKISIDSATMMNKSLELIEAWHLFPIEKSQLEILVHPQSIIHSMVHYVDGSVLAQLGTPDMSTPIAYALAYPERMTSNSGKLNLAEIGNLSFFPPDYEKFPALRLGKEALQAGGSAPSILNAANEIAVERFLNKQISFGEIAQIVEKTLERIPVSSPTTIDEVLAIDRQARQIANSI
ncbi:MAG: 1-deoxy-D-xylulose-5-phosphate reductoisomerase, partial [Pseudomonadota bacterium]